MSFTKRLKMIGAVLAMAGALGLAPAAAQDAKPQHLKMGSFNVGGSWYIYATTIADLAQKALPEGWTVEVLPYQGGVGNPILVNRGKADIALSFSALSNWAYNGKVTYKEPQKNIRALVGGLNTPHRLAIIARAGLGISSLADLKEQKKPVRLVTVQIGGAGEALARMATTISSRGAARSRTSTCRWRFSACATARPIYSSTMLAIVSPTSWN
jgi:uncharacterized protein